MVSTYMRRISPFPVVLTFAGENLVAHRIKRHRSVVLLDLARPRDGANYIALIINKWSTAIAMRNICGDQDFGVGGVENCTKRD